MIVVRAVGCLSVASASGDDIRVRVHPVGVALPLACHPCRLLSSGRSGGFISLALEGTWRRFATSATAAVAAHVPRRNLGGSVSFEKKKRSSNVFTTYLNHSKLIGEVGNFLLL